MAQVVALQPEHWPAVRAIYETGMATGNATFETDAPPWELWDAKHLAEHRFVALVDEDVAGCVAAGTVSDRWLRRRDRAQRARLARPPGPRGRRSSARRTHRLE
jgi:L-amino acid N-acyltransferase YncA